MMKGTDAMRKIFDYERGDTGFRVHFERLEGSMLHSDFFPARGENLIPSEEQAWELVKRFAKATRGVCVNVYVINQHWAPVKGYEERKIQNR